MNTGKIQPETALKPRILVVDDHFLIAQSITMLLAPHFDVVGVVTDAKLAADEVARLRPEVVLLDVAMPGLSGLDAARLILKRAPRTKIAFLTMHSNQAILREAREIGASAYIVKNCSAAELVRAMNDVLKGGTYVSPEIQEKLSSDPSETLSERQIDVLRLLAQGFTTKQIAFELSISSRTAEFHKNAIMEKLDLRTVAQLTRYAIENGLGS